jgi:hypothetical protein
MTARRVADDEARHPLEIGDGSARSGGARRCGRSWRPRRAVIARSISRSSDRGSARSSLEDGAPPDFRLHAEAEADARVDQEREVDLLLEPSNDPPCVGSRSFIRRRSPAGSKTGRKMCEDPGRDVLVIEHRQVLMPESRAPLEERASRAPSPRRTSSPPRSAGSAVRVASARSPSCSPTAVADHRGRMPKNAELGT